MKKINKVLVAIILFGAGIRLYLCLTRNVFTDEVFYFRVARDYNFQDFLSINHWIKDHAILHFVVLKASMLLSSKIAYLRLINIIYYIGSALTIFKIFRALKLGKWAFLPVIFFSVHGYFIHIASMILPYNIAIFFTLLSVFFCVQLFIVEGKRVWSNYAAFVSFTALAFYSDYSFLAVFLFYFFILIFVFIFKKSKRLLLFLSYGTTMVFILPGISQLLHNLPEIQRLNTSDVRTGSLIISLQQFCSMTILHDQPTLSFLIYLLYLTFFITSLTYICHIRKKRESVHNFFVVIGATYYVSTIVFLSIHRHIFPIFVERAVWFFPLFTLMMISLLIFFYYNLKRKLFLFIFLLFMATRLLNLFVTSGNITYEVSYKSFLKDYAVYNAANEDNYLFIVDNDYVLFPLRYYYLSPKHSIFDTALDENTKWLLKEKRPTILYLKVNELSLYPLELPKKTLYSVVLPTCEQSSLLDNLFVKKANAVYCLQYLEDKKYTFIRII